MIRFTRRAKEEDDMCEHCVSGAGPHVSDTPGLLTRRETLIGMGVGTTLLGGSALSGSAIAQERGTKIPALDYAATASEQPLERYSFSRRAVGRNDVLIDIQYCGICHTDVHAARNDFGNTVFPLMPGHEIVGRVSAIGSAVTRFKVGDAVGVGCMVDSCGICEFCMSGLEQFCTAGNVQTYGFSRARGTNFLGGKLRHQHSDVSGSCARSTSPVCRDYDRFSDATLEHRRR